MSVHRIIDSDIIDPTIIVGTKITRSWAMPNKDTFSIKPINNLLNHWIDSTTSVCDPFCNGKKFHDNTITNDLDSSLEADFHMDALDFLKSRANGEFSCVLFDPPYSPRQVSESYKKLGKSVNMQTTQSSYWSKLKKEVARVLKDSGIAITCGWNSGGIGKTLGFKIEEILLVPHGGWHNDTIITVESKI